jgi:DNA gyrase/topoisomerase IV subunit A
MDTLERLRMVDARSAIVEALVLVCEESAARRLLEVVFASADQDTACLRIADEFGLSAVQARALTDVQFCMVTQERRQGYLEELDRLKASRERLCAELAL